MSNVIVCSEYGVNPSLEKCYFCGKDSGVVLFGSLPVSRYEKMFGHKPSEHKNGKAQAPKSVVSSLTPCKDCEAFKDMSSKGCILIRSQGGSFTMDHVVITDEAVMRTFTDKAAKDVIKHRMAVLENDVWKDLGLPVH